MLVEDILNKEQNNFNLLRLLAAFSVIYGHAYLNYNQDIGDDIVRRIIRFDHAGSLAVKLFFFISGLLVTNSLLTKKNVIDYLIARIFRIYPGLIVVLLLSAIIIGPIFAVIPTTDYFLDKHVYGYVVRNLLLDFRPDIPNVFAQNKYFEIMNGSLWTIRFEFFWYMVVLSLFLTRALSTPSIFLLLFIVTLHDAVADQRYLFTWLTNDWGITFLGPCFLFGCSVAIWKKEIKLSIELLLGLWILSLLMKGSVLSPFFLYTAAFLSAIYIFSLPALLKIKTGIDISYGTYLYSYPIQQILFNLFPNWSIWFHIITAIVLSAFCGYISWNFIEKPSIAIGHKLSSKISRHIGLEKKVSSL